MKGNRAISAAGLVCAAIALGACGSSSSSSGGISSTGINSGASLVLASAFQSNPGIILSTLDPILNQSATLNCATKGSLSLNLSNMVYTSTSASGTVSVAANNCVVTLSSVPFTISGSWTEQANFAISNATTYNGTLASATGGSLVAVSASSQTVSCALSVSDTLSNATVSNGSSKGPTSGTAAQTGAACGDSVAESVTFQ
jgi:hypothetical protein